jgi:ubiquinone/menaquinone biosynthesis C-methylase UbiE
MDHRKAGEYWERNAAVWTRLARAGYDVYRDYLNTPSFMAMLPDVTGLQGLDVGCGEGHNTRILARRGARITGADIAPSFIAAAAELEAAEPLDIRYLVASAVDLPFAASTFDFVVAIMSLMDVPRADRAIDEAYRVLRSGGFLQFSISHPCTDTPLRRLVRDESGRKVALSIAGYFEETFGRINRWLFGAAPPDLKRDLPPFETPYFHRTLSWWANTIVEAGFQFELMQEPTANEEIVRRCPDLDDTRLVPYFLHARCRKTRRSPEHLRCRQLRRVLPPGTTASEGQTIGRESRGSVRHRRRTWTATGSHRGSPSLPYRDPSRLADITDNFSRQDNNGCRKNR